MSDGDVVALTWHERELVAALRRLANAMAAVGALTAAAGGQQLDPDDVALALALDGERRDLEPKASARFGGSAARDRLAGVETELRLVLDRLQVGDLGALRDRISALESATPPDPDLVEFAHRELDTARSQYRELVLLELPPSEDGLDPSSGADAPDAKIVAFERRSVAS